VWHAGRLDAEDLSELFDDFIKLEWQDIFREEVQVWLDNGARYVPNSGSQGVQLLRKGVNAFDEAVRIWSGPTGDTDSGTKGLRPDRGRGWRRVHLGVVRHRPSPPMGRAVPRLVRDRIEADLNRRSRNAIANAEERRQEAERSAEVEDDAVIASMNAKRIETGRKPPTEQQEASVRESGVVAAKSWPDMTRPNGCWTGGAYAGLAPRTCGSPRRTRPHRGGETPGSWFFQLPTSRSIASGLRRLRLTPWAVAQTSRGQG
jgi:hypothetical protein